MSFSQYCKLLGDLLKKKKKQQLNIHRLHPILNYFLSVPEWHRFLLDKGVVILDLPMIMYIFIILYDNK